MSLKILILLILVPFVTCTPVNISEEWENWKNDYGQSYGSDAEEAHRYAIWKKNKKFIDDHNSHRNTFGYTLAMNQFGDLQTSEFADMFNGYKMHKQSNSNFFTTPTGFVPQDTIDWRVKGAVTPVKDQKKCGSCWAFSATGSLEGQHFIKKGRLVSLSEQNLVDCSTNYGNHGCRGGDVDRAFSYIQRNGGIDTEDSYPYKAVDGVCNFNPEDVGATVSGYVDLPERNETALMSAVSGIGPISVAIDASNKKISVL